MCGEVGSRRLIDLQERLIESGYGIEVACPNRTDEALLEVMSEVGLLHSIRPDDIIMPVKLLYMLARAAGQRNSQAVGQDYDISNRDSSRASCGD